MTSSYSSIQGLSLLLYEGATSSSKTLHADGRPRWRERRAGRCDLTEWRRAGQTGNRALSSTSINKRAFDDNAFFSKNCFHFSNPFRK